MGIPRDQWQAEYEDRLAEIDERPLRRAVWTALMLHYEEGLVRPKAIAIAARRARLRTSTVAHQVALVTGDFPQQAVRRRGPRRRLHATQRFLIPIRRWIRSSNSSNNWRRPSPGRTARRRLSPPCSVIPAPLGKSFTANSRDARSATCAAATLLPRTGKLGARGRTAHHRCC